MYPAAFEYHRVTSVEEAVGLLSRYKDDAKLLAGGHSLVPMMKLRLAQPKHLVKSHARASCKEAPVEPASGVGPPAITLA